MPFTPRQIQNQNTPRPSRSRQKPVESQFRPHERYPRLDANAGKDEGQSAGRVKRAARRPVTAARPATPRPFIRLNSAAAAPRLSARYTGRRIGRMVGNGRWISLLALVALSGLVYWLLTSNTFHVSKIEVKGSRSLDAVQVAQLTGVDKQNIFLLDESKVAAKIQALSYVLTAHVSKSLPDRLSVDITERQSVVNWKVGSTDYLVDNDGVILAITPDDSLPEQAKAFAVIESLDNRGLQIGDRVDTVAIRSAQTIQSQLAGAGFKIAAVQYSPKYGLSILSAPESGNWKALLGTDAQLDKKISILKGLLADKSIKWSSADLRFVNKPAIQ